MPGAKFPVRWQLALDGIALRHPDYTPREVELALRRSHWGEAIYRRTVPGNVTELLTDLIDLLVDLEIPYMVAGSVSSSLHGQVRSTQDLDIVVDLNDAGLEALFAKLDENRYYASLTAAREALHRKTQFNVIDLRTGGKIDLMILKSRPFSRCEFSRRRIVRALGRDIYLASPEDVILGKLPWNQISPSERQLRDVQGILQTQQGQLDADYLRSWATELKLKLPGLDSD